MTPRPADAPAIAALLEAAFCPDEAALVASLRAEGAVAVELVAEAPEGAILGHLMLSRMRVGAVAALALAPLAVAPEAQRRGIGGALVRHALMLAEAREEGWCLVLGKPPGTPASASPPPQPPASPACPGRGIRPSRPAHSAPASRRSPAPPATLAPSACPIQNRARPPPDPGGPNHAHHRPAAL